MKRTKSREHPLTGIAESPASALIAAKLHQANAYHQRGQLQSARAFYEDILKLQPLHFDATHLLGVIAAQTHDPKKAADLLGRAIRINPREGAPYCNLGIALQALKRWDEALANFDKAIAIRADYAVAFSNRGNVLKELHRFEEALESYARAIEIKPELFEAHLNVGDILCEVQQWEAALASYDRALALKRGSAEAWFKRGNVLHSLKRLDETLESYAKSLAIKPDYVEVYVNRGFVLKELRQLDDALADFTRAIELRPDFAEAHVNRATTLLLGGDLERGWPEYEWRWRAERAPNFNERRVLSAPLWTGQESLAGKTILLHSEQGLGDTLQFCRYAKLVAAMGATVVLEAQQSLLGVLDGLDGVSTLVATGAAIPRIDCHCPLLSLPLACKTTLATIPDANPYLRSDPARVAHWQGRLGPKTSPRVGLAWRGNTGHVNDHNRSIFLPQLIAILPDGLSYISVQKELSASERETLRAVPAIGNFFDELTDFSETAALCECLDLVISVDTSVAHLSAALGRKTWVLLPFNPDWRWLLDREDSPWYPSVKLYRQRTVGTWDPTFDRVRSDLSRLANGV